MDKDMQTLLGQSYRAHGQAEATQLKYISDCHAYEVQLAEEKKRDEDDTSCCGCSVKQRGPQGRVAASQHENENHVFKRLVDALPAQEQRGVEHGRGQGREHDAGGVQVERRG